MKQKRFLLYCALAWTFLIGNYQGYIALWQGSNPSPERVFPYRVASLPAADQTLVNRGIRVQTREELARLLEDYLS